MDEMLWHLTFRVPFLEDHMYYAAFGEEREWLPVFEMIGDIDDPSWLVLKPVDLIHPGCLRMMAGAEHVTLLAAMSRSDIEHLYPKETPLPEPTRFVQDCIRAANVGHGTLR